MCDGDSLCNKCGGLGWQATLGRRMRRASGRQGEAIGLVHERWTSARWFGWHGLTPAASVARVSKKRKKRSAARRSPAATAAEAESVTFYLNGPPPGAAEKEASERAIAVDRVWFERYPGADAYARPAVPHEHDRFMAQQGWTVPPGHYLVVVVEQVEPGRRLRHPMNVYRGDGPGGAMLPEHLESVLRHWRAEVHGKESFPGVPDEVIQAFRRRR